MPIIYRDPETGNIIKKGSNGCEDCGLPFDNEEIIVTGPSVSDTEDNTYTEEVEDDS